MPTLLHTPFACSMAVRFAAAEGEVPLAIQQVDLRTKNIVSGGTLYDTNALGQVSTLILEDGEILTENTAILMWVQSQSTKESFRRLPTDPHYFQLIRWIAFVSTELHKQLLRVVFYPEATDEVKDRIRGLAPARFALLDQQLSDSPFLLGENFSAADAYLSWFLVLASRARLDVSPYTKLAEYQTRTHARPAIKALIQEDSESKN